MENQPTRRAPGMSPERRREMIVAVALPLVAEYGAAVTTGQIARAAGIGEATIFRVFTDKNELLDACMAEALRPDHVMEQLAAIPLDQPLAARLTEAADAMHAFTARIGTVIGALHAFGHVRERPAPEPSAAPREKKSESFRDTRLRETREVLAELFEPDRDSLRLPPEHLAMLFLNLVRSNGRRPPGDPELSVTDIVDVFVHGALTRPDLTPSLPPSKGSS
ncbi:TetR/AcrR family transcriptional regulator [Streptosporangium sp. NBC_01469]|uniref:TetR/AcrR family transcriptional regulator n=1 Tax=Streptosporangium sp. NBC_01469 TaxID=2903898 RepID=UPI002E2A2B9A|nr:TetR/AcrR family transcriptional regulator [Streptosporangium sp. NBC_01469]